jgi:hypothetical protein
MKSANRVRCDDTDFTKRPSLSQRHTFHGTGVNAILLKTIIKVGPSLSADILYRISQKSVRRYDKFGYKFIYAPKCGVHHGAYVHKLSLNFCGHLLYQILSKTKEDVQIVGIKSLAPSNRELLSWYKISLNSAAQPDLNRLLQNKSGKHGKKVTYAIK